MLAIIPMLDMDAQHAAIGSDLDAAIAQVLDHKRFINGPEVGEFEAAFADFCGVEHCVGVSNGTTALELALEALGVGAGDEVITCGFTFIATVEAIVRSGATPVLVDVDYDSALTAQQQVEAAITDRTRAVIAVHLYGQPVDLRGFRELCDRRELKLIEDAAQAHGAEADGLRAGSVGDLATFSFFPGKNLGAIGDAGGVTTNDAELAERVRLLANHGRTAHYGHAIIGTNARLDTLQAAVLSVKLRRLDDWNRSRREHAHFYDERFAKIAGVEPIRELPGRSGVFHQYVLRVDDREALQAGLRERGIASAVHYPRALNRQPALEPICGTTALPNCDRLAERVMSIPVYPEMTKQQLEQVADAVSELIAGPA